MTTNAVESTTTRTSGTNAGGRARKQAAPRNGTRPTARSNRAPATRRRPAATTGPRTGGQGADGAEWGYPVVHALLAAKRTIYRNSVHVELPVMGIVQLPAKEELVFIGGVAGLAAVGVLEWPVAILLGVGHTLAANRHNRLMREFGEALEEA